ncbi:MAG: M48 family metallopeptidase [Desulfovibrio sp.]|jgi:predicted metal-dependent hydrolase|nr:M48 family metallopeptidase [Desulfovibrio sp.]
MVSIRNVPAGPPPHCIRRSSRARRILLRVLPGRGLEVVLPARADPACVPDLLSLNSAWIAKALARMPAPLPPGRFPPASFFIKGGKEEILTSCSLAAAPQDPPGPLPLRRHLLVPQDPAAAPAFLRSWVLGEARALLVPRLDQLAREHGFIYSGSAVRLLRSRWGSCSAAGRIHLNACLLFLPESLVRHILLHELCHTRRLDHSPAFWRLLFALEPDAVEKDKALRRAWRHVPAWIFN